MTEEQTPKTPDKPEAPGQPDDSTKNVAAAADFSEVQLPQQDTNNDSNHSVENGDDSMVEVKSPCCDDNQSIKNTTHAANEEL